MPYQFATVTVIFCAAVAAIIHWSDAHPERSIWPPRHFGWTARIVTWGVTAVAIGAAYYAGKESWNAWGWPGWLRWTIGAPLIFIVSYLSSWAIVKLGPDQSMGANRGLVTDGVFARSRNPTYLGNLALCFGWIVLAASWPATIAAGALAALYVFAVPYEERWLARTYGEAYEAYRARVRRWL